MPYNPQIAYDSSGLANGIASAGQSIAQGLREQQINQAKDKEAQGIVTGLLQANPDILQGADEKTAKLLEKFRNGETGLKDNIFLAGWASMTQKGIEKKQEMQAQQMQNQLQSIQLAQAMKAQAAQDRQTALLKNMTAGIGGGVYSPAVQQQQANNPALKYAAQMYAATGQVPSNDVIEKFLTSRYNSENPMLETATVENTNDKGQPVIQTVNKRTGKVLGERVVAPAGVLMPEDAARAAQLTGRVAQAMKDNQEVIDNGKASVQSLYAIDNARRLLDRMKSAGNSTGALAPIKAEAQAIAKSIGIDIGNPSDMQALKAAIGPMVIGDIKEVTSRMTNMELQAFQKFTANPTNTDEANNTILDVRESAHRRGILLAQMTNDLRRTPDYKSGKLTEADINDRINEFELKNPIPIPGLKIENPVGGKIQPSAQSIQMLKQHPELRDQFDERYGKGAADFYLK